MTATAHACANIALVKYWGKRAGAGNVPAASSLSVTLAALTTTTTVELDATLTADLLELDGAAADATRAAEVLAMVRARAGGGPFARVRSANDFPTASGLASSASAFAALVTAADAAYRTGLDAAERSRLARRGSASAARSIYGGFVLLPGGDAAGPDPAALPVAAGDALDVRVVIALVGEARKAVSSRAGMRHTAETSPYYPAWLTAAEADAPRARDLVLAGDLEALGELTEASCLAMHASAMAARPGVIYFRGASLDAMARVRELRAAGHACWFTADAGPHVKALCRTADAPVVAAALAAVPGVTRTITSAPGDGARVG